jgi:type III restriction enzyme
MFDDEPEPLRNTANHPVRDREARLQKVIVDSERWVEADCRLDRARPRPHVGVKSNILVPNDEAHHAYRIRADNGDEDDEDAEQFYKEATIWTDGLDRIHRLRGINFCLDLSTTPFFLGRVGQDSNRPFPWVVRDFSLMDAIESGLVKVPQLPVRDNTGAAIPNYFNIWDRVLAQMTSSERGGSRGQVKPASLRFSAGASPLTLS